ncbi:MAG: hypothetical protein FLDDKLPJ_02794 [Phycisphaerae bacterium]|nr:hypothetical protein [Phycisphaerae bacterium]
MRSAESPTLGRNRADAADTRTGEHRWDGRCFMCFL